MLQKYPSDSCGKPTNHTKYGTSGEAHQHTIMMLSRPAARVTGLRSRYPILITANRIFRRMRKNSSATTSSTEKNETTRGRNRKFHAWAWNALIGSGNPYRVLLNGVCLQRPRGRTATRLVFAPSLVGVSAVPHSRDFSKLNPGYVHVPG